MRDHVRGVFLMCRAFLPAMVAAGTGDLINVASVSGKRPLARRTPYTASKMAVLGLTATLAATLGASVHEAEQAFVSRAGLGRMVEESEVADAVIAMLHMPGMAAADVDLSAGMVAR
jgi:NADP-dependent 3-hydroxy acid dehydrogenase YdfG